MQNAWQKESKIVELHIQNLSLNFQCLSYNIVAGKFVRRKNTLIWIKSGSGSYYHPDTLKMIITVATVAYRK